MILTVGSCAVIEKLRKSIKELYGGFWWLLEGWGCYLIVICFLLMLCGKYSIVEKFRVNFVGKVNVERWSLFLMLVKS